MYVQAAHAFVVIVDPADARFIPGEDPMGDGTLNVRALSQRCPHLGCRPNPCIEDFWFHCPCHQSRYDRLGIKPAGKNYGPAGRGMDRFAVEVDADGVLTIDTSHVTLGPLPITLGQPGVILPLVPHEQACN
jgi:cytochrome b6-f complex iron-sulfur subunit